MWEYLSPPSLPSANPPSDVIDRSSSPPLIRFLESIRRSVAPPSNTRDTLFRTRYEYKISFSSFAGFYSIRACHISSHTFHPVVVAVRARINLRLVCFIQGLLILQQSPHLLPYLLHHTIEKQPKNRQNGQGNQVLRHARCMSSRMSHRWNFAKPFIQVSPTATEQELKKAYKVGALKYHPGMFLSPSLGDLSSLSRI